MIWNAYHSFYDGGALSPASQGDIIQWLNGGVDSTDSSEANDKLFGIVASEVYRF